MATASDIIKGALRKLGIRESETAISDPEMQDALDDLNDLGSDKGLFSPVENPSDTIRVPRKLEGALKMVLAEKVIVDYADIPLTPQLQKQFSEAWDDIWRVTNGTIEVNFPNTLPLGSGNEDSYYLWDYMFFREQETPNF